MDIAFDLLTQSSVLSDRHQVLDLDLLAKVLTFSDMAMQLQYTYNFAFDISILLNLDCGLLTYFNILSNIHVHQILNIYLYIHVFRNEQYRFLAFALTNLLDSTVIVHEN